MHPYNKDAVGSVFTRSFTEDSMSMAYASRATRVLRQAERYGRIPRGQGRLHHRVRLPGQAARPQAGAQPAQARRTALNESDRLFYGDPRIRAVAQFELYDVAEPRERGHLQHGPAHPRRPAAAGWGAYRMPLVVTKLAADQVEVWGQVRPANARTRVALFAAREGGAFARIGSPATNASGYFKLRVPARRRAALRYRTTWASPNGETFPSRTATAGQADQVPREALDPLTMARSAA